LGDRLEVEHKVRLRPLTMFYDARFDAIRTDPIARGLVESAGADALESEMGALASIAAKAVATGKRMRLLYQD